MPRLLALLVLVTLAANPVRGDVKLPAIISKNMMIQQGMKIPVWGWAAPGEKVSVALAGHQADTSADAAGRWKCELAPLPPAEKPLVMTVTGKNTLTVDNILVGDLWLCAGQSNMGWQVKNSDNGAEEAKTANYPAIRFFSLTGPMKGEPQEDLRGTWYVCTPKTAATFSAVGYFFGRQLHQDLKRPIGLIGAGWGGSHL